MSDPKNLLHDDVIIAYTESSTDMAHNAAQVLRDNWVTVELSSITTKTFPSGEMLPQVEGNVREAKVYLFFTFDGDPNVGLINLQLCIEALHLAGSDRIILVTPFLPYLRQDRKDQSRVPISASMMIRNIESCESVKRTITFDMHSDQMQAVFRKPTDHFPGSVVFANWIKERFADNMDEIVLVAPDVGSANRVRSLRKRIDENMPMVILDKERDDSGTEVHNVIGSDSIKGKICIVYDDMVDTGGTLRNAIQALRDHGAAEIYVTTTHGVLSPHDGTTAYDKLSGADFKLVITDSLPTENREWIEVIPLYNYMAHIILQNITKKGSVSKLIEEGLPS